MHPAKSDGSWEQFELHAFNIEVVRENKDEFFGQPLSNLQLDVSKALLNCLDEPPTVSNVDSEFFAYLEDATAVFPNEEAFVGDFAACVLRIMGYGAGHRIVHQRKTIPFEMCGQRVRANVDVCVLERGAPKYLLLVYEDKRHLGDNQPDPEPQLIAGTIAAFVQNNKRRELAGLLKISHAIMPGIVMTGSAPIFYKIPVSEDLVKAVVTGQYPPFTTTVQRFIPPVRDRLNYLTHGMKPLENRRTVLQCFEACKSLMCKD